MYTYAVIGLPFLGCAIALDMLVLKTRVMASKQGWIVMAVMVGLTAVFDQLLTGLPIVTYNESHILGIYIGYAPIEDFLYTIAAVIGLGSLSKHYEQR